MNWKGMRVLVTGAGGFIGSHLTEELARRGAKVRALVRYNSRNHWGLLEGLARQPSPYVDVWPGDICDPYFVAKLVQSQEVVFHLAALISIPYSYAAPQSFVSVNVQGTLSILEACLRHKVKKFIHTSTSEVYGTARYVPIDEGHPLNGQSPYSASKIAADHLVESFHRSFDLPAAIVRPFNTYGPRQSARAIIPTIITQALRGNSSLALGSVEPIRDFNYVEDAVSGFLAVAQKSQSVGQVINLGSGRGLSVRAIADRILALTGRDRHVAVRNETRRVRPRKSEVLRLVCDNRKARRLLGWRPRFALEEGLTATVNYVRAHLSEYKPGFYNI